jgi:hypothetical protein
MWPDSPYAVSVGSFRRPVPLVTVDPDIEPDVTVCFRREWLPYIVGSLQQLLLQSTWKTDDPAALNLAQARAQLLIALFLEGCPPDANAGIEFDGEELMASLCESLRWQDGKLQALCCGDWTDIGGTSGAGAIPGAVTQPPPSSAPPVNGCRDFYVTLNARDQWILPFPVSAGATIQIQDAVGGWNDGTPTWACPTGSVYGLGICGAPLALTAGDPIPTLPHMQIVGKYGTGAGGWFDPMAFPYVIPVGVTDAQVIFQANDSVLTDNSGSVTFKVSVCNVPLATYDRLVDFRIATNGFVNYPANEGPGCNPTMTPYTPGVGWQAFDCPSIGASYIEIINSPFAAATIEDITLTFTTDDIALTASDAEVFLELAGGETLVGSLATPWSATNVLHVTGSWLATGIRIRIGIASTTANVLITSLQIKGPETAPF